MRGWEDFVKDVMEGNFVIEGVIGDEEVKMELPSKFEAGFRKNSVIKSIVDLESGRKATEELEGTRDRGAQECRIGLRVPRSELLKRLDKWEVLELVDELLEGDTKCVTCGKAFCIKKLLDYHGRN